MRSVDQIEFLNSLQTDLYLELNKYSRTHKNRGRALAIPAALLDTALDTVKIAALATTNLFLAIINLIAAPFRQNCTLKHSLHCAEKAFVNFASKNVKLLIAPVKLIFQLFAGIYRPDFVMSVRENFTFQDRQDVAKTVYMKGFDEIDRINNVQTRMYTILNNYSQQYKTLCRLSSLFVAAADVVLDTVKAPILLICNICLIFYNIFNRTSSLKDALHCAEKALVNFASLEIKVIFAPIKLIYQIAAILIHPDRANSVRADTTFKPAPARAPVVVVASPAPFVAFSTPGHSLI